VVYDLMSASWLDSHFRRMFSCSSSIVSAWSSSLIMLSTLLLFPFQRPEAQDPQSACGAEVLMSRLDERDMSTDGRSEGIFGIDSEREDRLGIEGRDDRRGTRVGMVGR
jgi:hypothetical protein